MVIASSDFKRARETAQIIHAELNVTTPIRFNPGLRERFMGDLDLSVYPATQQVYREDEIDPHHTEFNAESTVSVARRIAAFVQTLNAEFQGRIILLVSHKNPLQILNSLFVGIPLSLHRKSYKPQIGCCDITELKINKFMIMQGNDVISKL